MYTSSHGNKDDSGVYRDGRNGDIFVMASGRFIAPASTLPRMKRSLNVSAAESPFSLAPDSTSNALNHSSNDHGPQAGGDTVDSFDGGKNKVSCYTYILPIHNNQGEIITY